MVPSLERPSEGEIEVSVDCAAALFSGCRGRRDQRDMVNTELTGAIRRLLEKSLPLASLCIMTSRFAWRLFVDVLVVQNDGCILDASSFAVWAALHNSSLPRLTPVEAQAGFEDDFLLDSSPEAATSLDAAAVPVNLSFNLLGRSLVLDATRHEESCGSARVAISVNATGHLCGMHQAGTTTISPGKLEAVFSSAVEVAGPLFKGLQEGLSRKPLGEFPDVPSKSLGFFA